MSRSRHPRAPRLLRRVRDLHEENLRLKERVAQLQRSRRRWIDAIAAAIGKGDGEQGPRWNTPEEATEAIRYLIRWRRP